MPIYEYTCVTCHNRFDKRRSMSQIDDPAPCPDCGERVAARVLGVRGVLVGRQRADERGCGRRRVLRRQCRRWVRVRDGCVVSRTLLT